MNDNFMFEVTCVTEENPSIVTKSLRILFLLLITVLVIVSKRREVIFICS